MPNRNKYFTHSSNNTLGTPSSLLDGLRPFNVQRRRVSPRLRRSAHRDQHQHQHHQDSYNTNTNNNTQGNDTTVKSRRPRLPRLQINTSAAPSSSSTAQGISSPSSSDSSDSQDSLDRFLDQVVPSANLQYYMRPDSMPWRPDLSRSSPKRGSKRTLSPWKSDPRSKYKKTLDTVEEKINEYKQNKTSMKRLQERLAEYEKEDQRHKRRSRLPRHRRRSMADYSPERQREKRRQKSRENEERRRRTLEQHENISQEKIAKIARSIQARQHAHERIQHQREERKRRLQWLTVVHLVLRSGAMVRGWEQQRRSRTAPDRETEAARQIQSFVRRRTPTIYVPRKHAALVIQRTVREYLEGRRCARMRYATETVMAFLRDIHSSLRMPIYVRRYIRSVTKIQTCWREHRSFMKRKEQELLSQFSHLIKGRISYLKKTIRKMKLKNQTLGNTRGQRSTPTKENIFSFKNHVDETQLNQKIFSLVVEREQLERLPDDIKRSLVSEKLVQKLHASLQASRLYKNLKDYRQKSAERKAREQLIKPSSTSPLPDDNPTSDRVTHDQDTYVPNLPALEHQSPQYQSSSLRDPKKPSNPSSNVGGIQNTDLKLSRGEMSEMVRRALKIYEERQKEHMERINKNLDQEIRPDSHDEMKEEQDDSESSLNLIQMEELNDISLGDELTST